MSLIDIIKKRRSIREFHKKEISRENIDKLIDSLIWAPSAGNLQSRRFFFIFNTDLKKQLANAALGQHFIADAPLVCIACVDNRIEKYYGKRGVELYAIQDVAASVENMLLMACEMELGSVWVGAFHEDEVSEAMKLPKNLRPVAMVAIGYPAENPSPPPRVSSEDAVKFIL